MWHLVLVPTAERLFSYGWLHDLCARSAAMDKSNFTESEGGELAEVKGWRKKHATQ